MAKRPRDSDALLSTASSLQSNGHFQRALDIYLFLADRDVPVSLRIAECYEALGRLTEARYWAARTAVAQPGDLEAQRTAARLGSITVEQLELGSFSETWDSAADDKEFDETQRLLATIPGGEELLQWFGGRASFHDAEVVSLRLDRATESRLELVTRSRGPNATVAFILSDWIDTELSGFSQQNVIGDLILRRPSVRTIKVWERGVGVKAGMLEIELMPIFGAYGVIRATIPRIEFAADKAL